MYRARHFRANQACAAPPPTLSTRVLHRPSLLKTPVPKSLISVPNRSSMKMTPVPKLLKPLPRCCLRSRNQLASVVASGKSYELKAVSRLCRTLLRPGYRSLLRMSVSLTARPSGAALSINFFELDDNSHGTNFFMVDNSSDSTRIDCRSYEGAQ